MENGIPQIAEFAKSCDECIKNITSLRDVLKKQNVGDDKQPIDYEKEMNAYLATLKKLQYDAIKASLKMASDSFIRNAPR